MKLYKFIPLAIGGILLLLGVVALVMGLTLGSDRASVFLIHSTLYGPILLIISIIINYIVYIAGVVKARVEVLKKVTIMTLITAALVIPLIIVTPFLGVVLMAG